MLQLINDLNKSTLQTSSYPPTHWNVYKALVKPSSNEASHFPSLPFKHTVVTKQQQFEQ